jgi:hypothetical protein
MKNPDPRSMAADGRAYIPRSRADDDVDGLESVLLVLVIDSSELLLLEEESDKSVNNDVYRLHDFW